MQRLFLGGVAVGLMLLVAAPTDAGQRRLQRKAGRVAQLQERRPAVRAKRVARLFQSLDKDRSGSISRDEWLRNAKGFDRLDANKDGQLTSAELNRVPVRKARRRR